MPSWKDNLRVEIEQGGTESPCPFCHIPRVRRSDYIRCCACGINWMAGEKLQSDPRAQRLREFLANCQQTKKAPQTENGKAPLSESGNSGKTETARRA